jgi:hypothetical protein
MSFLIYFIRIVYPCCSGLKDAILWGRKGADSYTWDEHNVFIIERIFQTLYVLFVIVLWYLSILTPLDLIISEIAYILSFPFFQDSFYYEGRKRIDGAYKGFWDDSATSTAKLNFKFKTRLLLFLFGILTIVLYEAFA